MKKHEDVHDTGCETGNDREKLKRVIIKESIIFNQDIHFSESDTIQYSPN